jgi:hypothetical protein
MNTNQSLPVPKPDEQSRTSTQPTTAELRTAIEVLKMLGQRINDHAAHSVTQLPNTELGDQYAGHIEARAIEQTSHIEKASVQLQNWRDELLQQRKQQVAQSV